MSRLFKDPINNGVAQFDHVQSNSKKWPKGKKDQIVPHEFFSRKTTNKIFLNLFAPFIRQNLKKLLELIQGCKDVPISGSKWPISLEQSFFGTNHCYYFHLSIGPFDYAKF